MPCRTTSYIQEDVPPQFECKPKIGLIRLSIRVFLIELHRPRCAFLIQAAAEAVLRTGRTEEEAASAAEAAARATGLMQDPNTELHNDIRTDLITDLLMNPMTGRVPDLMNDLINCLVTDAIADLPESIVNDQITDRIRRLPPRQRPRNWIWSS